MRKQVLALLAALALASTAWTVGLVFNDEVSVTSANTAVSFTDNGSGGSSAAFRARSVTVYSLPASTDVCYVDWKDTTATTDDTPIDPGGTWKWVPGAVDGLSGIGVVCGAGDTATFRITATRF